MKNKKRSYIRHEQQDLEEQSIVKPNDQEVLLWNMVAYQPNCDSAQMKSSLLIDNGEATFRPEQ